MIGRAFEASFEPVDGGLPNLSCHDGLMPSLAQAELQTAYACEECPDAHGSIVQNENMSVQCDLGVRIRFAEIPPTFGQAGGADLVRINVLCAVQYELGGMVRRPSQYRNCSARMRSSRLWPGSNIRKRSMWRACSISTLTTPRVSK